MARTITEIQNEIIEQVAINPVLSTLATSTSKTAIWRNIANVVATVIWTVETLFDLHRTETDAKIAALKPHSLQWYAGKAVDFQYGYSLPADSDVYDNTGEDETEVENSKIVDYAAVVEQERGLRIKVAKDDGSDLVELSNPELSAFIEYMKRIKDAGVRLSITSGPADSLKLSLDVYYDPLVLNSEGERIDGFSSEPVQDAIKKYLKNLPFNGVFVVQSLIDVLQQVEGVKIAHVASVLARYGLLPFQSFSVKYVPDSGYLRLSDDSDLTINFIAYSE